jgi:hypothetical protein
MGAVPERMKLALDKANEVMLPIAAWLALTAVLALASGCYTAAGVRQPEPVRLQTPFDPSAVAWAAKRGDNRIEGTALLRTRGGEPRTCAALHVGLIPWSRHAGERMARLYGSIQSGYNARAPYGRMIRWENDDAAFYETVRSTACDAAGRFVFDDLPDGDWFVEAMVTWDVPRAGFVGGPQGGTLMRRVKAAGGETVSVVLTTQ